MFSSEDTPTRNTRNMSYPNNIIDDLTPEKIEESWQAFKDCGDDHKWVEQDESSPFFKICSRCGGAEGLRFPNIL